MTDDNQPWKVTENGVGFFVVREDVGDLCACTVWRDASAGISGEQAREIAHSIADKLNGAPAPDLVALRDLFAAAAANGLQSAGLYSSEDVASRAYELADAMLAARGG